MDMEQRLQNRIDDMADATAEADANAQGWSFFDDECTSNACIESQYTHEELMAAFGPSR